MVNLALYGELMVLSGYRVFLRKLKSKIRKAKNMYIKN